MSYRSKYDKYWTQKLNELVKAIELAYANGLSIIDINDIASYGRRRPECWYGKIVLCRDTIVKDSVMVHLKSLGRILLSNQVLKNYDSCFSFKVSKDLKLEIKRVSRDTIMDYHHPSVVRKRHTGHIMTNRELEFRKSPLGVRCKCDSLFHDFLWHELSTLRAHNLPGVPGVYVIRVIEKGEDMEEAKRQLEDIILKASWKELIEYVNSRLRRVLRIRDCPVIYIGSTGNLRSRYKDLAGIRHTAFFPILALLLSRWNLDYGFKIASSKKEAEHLENELKRGYIDIHGMLPALIEE